MIDYIVSHNNAIIDRAQPARHDNAAATGVIQAANLIRQAPADSQSFEFRPEACTGEVSRVVLERDRRRRFRVHDPLVAIGHVFLQ